MGGISALVSLSEPQVRDAALEQVEAIFFETASRTVFGSDAERDAFRECWLTPYLLHNKEQVFLALGDDRRVTGYLTGCLDTASQLSAFSGAEDMAAFSAHYGAYPAHFHINVTADSRDGGVGADLVAAFRVHCREAGVAGMHVITDAGARNVPFYRRCGLLPVASVEVGGKDLVMLGESLV